MFISFEGPEGGGKTTQIARLKERLTALGRHVITTREPGGTPIGDRVRGILLDRDSHIAPMAELLLYSASRAQLVETVIRPQLAAGGIVICDRYADSTLAYQGYGRGLSLEALRQITAIATGGLQPHLTLCLDLDPAEGLRRRHASGEALNRLDALELAFHERVRAGYHALIAAEPGRWAVIDAARPPDQVAESVWEAVRARL